MKAEIIKDKKAIWEVLSQINCNEHTEKKNGLTYLSWAWAWGIVKEKYPSANYEVVTYNGRPYLHDEFLGYMVSTVVAIDGESICMNLPVMDGANKSMKHIEWSYKVKEYKGREWTGKYIDKKVEPATMFDINTAIMRCLVKNLAMFGLGHYIYAGEDLPQETEEAFKDKLEAKIEEVNKCTTTEQLTQIWASNVALQANEQFKSSVAEKGKSLKAK